MAENRRGKENRFYFSRSQMVLLGAAFTLASLVIFILGMFVGKSIEARKLRQQEEPLVRIPIKPTAPQSSAVAVPPSKEELTFNESVGKQSAGGSKTDDKAVKSQIRQDVKNEAATPRAAEKKTEKASVAGETTRKADASASQDDDKSWRAQVNAFPDERSAKQIVDRLKNKGYNAYVTEVQNRGKSWYRVSVGKYASREEADKTVEALRTKENFPKAFTASR